MLTSDALVLVLARQIDLEAVASGQDSSFGDRLILAEPLQWRMGRKR